MSETLRRKVHETNVPAGGDRWLRRGGKEIVLDLADDEDVLVDLDRRIFAQAWTSGLNLAIREAVAAGCRQGVAQALRRGTRKEPFEDPAARRRGGEVIEVDRREVRRLAEATVPAIVRSQVVPAIRAAITRLRRRGIEDERT